MPDKYIIQRRTASGLENVAELPALENGKVDLSWLPVVGAMGSAIIERGSNANGEYVRWADGTQVCTKRVIFTGEEFSAWGTIWTTPIRTLGSWAAVFAELSAWFVEVTAGNSSSMWYVPQAVATINNCGTGSACRGSTQTQCDITYACFAVGRWK